MAYTPTHTFVAGDNIDAGQVNKNISEIQEYLNGQIADADMRLYQRANTSQSVYYHKQYL